MSNNLLLQPKSFLKRIYSKALWNIDTSNKEIYLTFDDGPIPELTDWVLQELGKYDAKATFFCVGENVVKNKNLYDSIVEKGHAVANHTQHHIKGFKTNTKEYIKDVERCAKHVKSRLFRPPYGQLKRGQYKALVNAGYKIIMWDVISYDYESISEQNCLENITDNTKEGSIILLHDNIKAERNLRFTLPRILEKYHSLNYNFRAIQTND